MKIVLLSGKQGAGKTSVQKALAEAWFKKYGAGALYINFADIIYEMHDHVLEVLHQYWPNRGLSKDGPLLQLLGTDWGRKTVDENIWVKCLQKKVELRMRGPEHEQALVLVGDCRFRNEFDAFPEALRVRLDAPEYIRQARCSMWRENTTHPSEVGLDETADGGAFDLYLNTWSTDVAGCVSLLMVALEKNSWIGRRRK
jgi:hypothetical protein